MYKLLITTIAFVNSNAQYLNISETQLEFETLYQADTAYKNLLTGPTLEVPNYSSIKIHRAVTKLY